MHFVIVKFYRFSIFSIQGGDLKDASKHDVFSEMAIIDIWFRTDKAMIMYLSDGTLQVYLPQLRRYIVSFNQPVLREISLHIFLKHQ